MLASAVVMTIVTSTSPALKKKGRVANGSRAKQTATRNCVLVLFKSKNCPACINMLSEKSVSDFWYGRSHVEIDKKVIELTDKKVIQGQISAFDADMHKSVQSVPTILFVDYPRKKTYPMSHQLRNDPARMEEWYYQQCNKKL